MARIRTFGRSSLGTSRIVDLEVRGVVDLTAEFRNAMQERTMRRQLQEREEIPPPSPGEPEIEVDFTRPVYPNIYRDKIWITKDGDIVPIPDMQTSHLKNCINLCKAKPKWWRTQLFLKLLEEELKRREENPEQQVIKKRRIRTTNEDSAVGIKTQTSKLSDK